MEQFAGRWYPLDRNTQTALEGGFDESEELGFGAVVGDEVWDQTARVRIGIGPLSLEQYQDFLPQGTAFESLRALTHFFSNGEFDFEIKLILDRRSAALCAGRGRRERSPTRMAHLYQDTAHENGRFGNYSSAMGREAYEHQPEITDRKTQ